MTGDWLLCDFHIHTSFSDGELSLPDVVRLYGENGFDAIGISDHIGDRRWLERCAASNEPAHALAAAAFPAYLQSLWQAAREAWERYGMLVIPGAEITNNSDGYHILAIDIKEYVEPGLPVEEIVAAVHAQGGIAVASHPHRGSLDGSGQLMHLWDNRERFASIFDAWEVANRDDLFNVVGLKKFNYIANSDFHSPRHLYSWKTLLRCEKNTEAIKAAIRTNHGVGVYLYRSGKQALAEGRGEGAA